MTAPRPTAGAAMGGGRSFVDATGRPVPLRGPVRQVVATDEAVGAMLLDLGATVVGCAGHLDGVEAVGESRDPDVEAVRAVRPDAIITGLAGGTYDLVHPVMTRLGQIAPVIAVDLERRAATAAEMRALLGVVAPPPHRSYGRHEDPATE